MNEQRAYYYDRYFAIDALKLKPGEFIATDRQIMLVTTLGSCVSVCLRDPYSGIIGMNHFLLPQRPHDSSNLYCASYGVHAMEMLINDMISLGANKASLQAKAFGGANVLASLSLPNIGQRNAHFVQEYLRVERIPLLAYDFEGLHPRKIYLMPDTGEVKMKRIKQLNNDTIAQREADYVQFIENDPDKGSVLFFD
jgi:chemotaxis protein CheD